MQSSRRRSEPGSGSTLLTRMTGKKSPSGPLSRIRSSIATEGPLETAWRNPGKIVWPWRSAPGGYCAPCQKEQSPAEIAELPGRSRTATGRKFSALRSMPGRRRTSRTLMTARQSQAGTLTRTRYSTAPERAPRLDLVGIGGRGLGLTLLFAAPGGARARLLGRAGLHDLHQGRFDRWHRAGQCARTAYGGCNLEDVPDRVRDGAAEGAGRPALVKLAGQRAL